MRARAGASATRSAPTPSTGSAGTDAGVAADRAIRAAQDPRRIAQIARRKLQVLGIRCETSRDGTQVVGVVSDADTQLADPRNGAALGDVGFRVEGHDRMVWTSPAAVIGLHPFDFYAFESGKSLVAAIQAAFAAHVATLEPVRERLEALGFAIIEDERIALIRAALELEGQGTVAIEADASAVRATEFRPFGGGEVRLLGGLALDLSDHASPTEAEIAVGDAVERRLRAAVTPPQTPARPAEADRPLDLAMLRPPGQSLSLAWLLETLGPDYYANDLVLARDLHVAGKTARFELKLQARDELQARLLVDGRPSWQGRLAPTKLSDLETLIAHALRNPTDAPEIAAPSDTVGLIPPVPGEIWVLQVQVEKSDALEVRYVGLNARGDRSGAPRILPREAFDEVFQAYGVGYRMLVRALSRNGQKVRYERVDADRNPAAPPREVDLAVFLSTFVAEATLHE